MKENEMAKEKIQIVIEDGELSGIKATENAAKALKDSKIRIEAVTFRHQNGDIRIFEDVTGDDRLLPLDDDTVYERHCTEEEEAEIRKGGSISMPQIKCVRSLYENDSIQNSGGYVLTNETAYGIALNFMNEFNPQKWDGRGCIMKGVNTKDCFHVFPFENQGNCEDCIDIWIEKDKNGRQKWKVVVKVNGGYRTEVYRIGSVYAVEDAIMAAWKISRERE